MEAIETTSGTVEGQLAELDEVYGTFSVDQTTVAVPRPRYERERATEPGRIEVYAKVQNDSGKILHVDADSPELPSTTVTDVADIESAARAAVREATGIECTCTVLDRAHIRGVRDADDGERETIYRLAVVVEGHRTVVSDDDRGVWQQTAEPSHARV
jgi:hypothetical protein